MDSKGNPYTGSFDPRGNSIGENGGPGIRIEGGSGTRMIGNHFFGNTGEEIVRAPSAVGPAAPVINSVISSPTQLVISGSVQGPANRQFRVEGYAEYVYFAGIRNRYPNESVEVTTDASGAATFQIKTYAGQDRVNALVTDLTTGETSIFGSTHPVSLIGGSSRRESSLTTTWMARWI